MNLHYQVACMDKQGYILEYKNFQWYDKEEMLNYIDCYLVVTKCAKIEITRWNEKGEKQ